MIGKIIRTVVASKLRLWRRVRKEQGLTKKAHGGTLWGEENVLYLERSIGYIGVCICQNALSSTPKIYVLCYI